MKTNFACFRAALLVAGIILSCLNVKAQMIILQATSSNHNGYNVSCNGGQDGEISISIIGGVAPYTVKWSDMLPVISGVPNIVRPVLPAGYIAVSITDVLNNSASYSKTLTEPPPLNVSITPSVYPPGNYNLSAWRSLDGSITTTATGGIPPYSYSWNDGVSTKDRTGLSALFYKIIVTDYNGCTASASITLTEPARNDWRTDGNSGTDPSTQFIGTTDSIGLSFRTFNQERMKISSNGLISIPIEKLLIDEPSSDSSRYVYIDHNGILKKIDPIDPNPSPCINYTTRWFTDYCNHSYDIYTSGNVGIGIKAPWTRFHVQGNSLFSSLTDFGITSAAYIRGVSGYSSAITPDYTWYNNDQTGLFHPSANTIAFTNGGTESMRIMKDAGGNISVGIGIVPNSSDNSNTYKLVVGGKLGAKEAWVSLGSPWPDYVFKKNYKLRTLYELEKFIDAKGHLPGLPSANEIAAQDKFNVGEMQIKLLEKTEENTLGHL